MTTRGAATSGGSEDPRALIRYALIGVALMVIISWVLFQVRDTLLVIYVAALVAIGLSPSVTAIQKHRRTPKRMQRWAAVLVIYLIFISILVAIAMLIFPPLIAQARELWAEAPGYLERWQQWLVDRGLLGAPLSVREAVEQAPGTKTDAVGTIFGAIWSVVGGIFGLVTILILAFYLMVDSDNIVGAFVRLFPRNRRVRVREACESVSTKVSAWLGGQLLLAGIIGSTAAIGLWLMGVPYFWVLALIAGIGETIPMVGPLLAAVPAVAVGFTVSPSMGAGVAVFFFIQQQVENHLLVPKVMERQVGVSAVAVIVALLLGGSLLGIVGAILAVPTAAILQVLVHELVPDTKSS
jgi:predicted PurR-regulated permease PerM